jgi:hypothetical protein
LEHFQTKLKENQVDYTTKPKPYNKSGKNDIRHNTGPYQEGNTSNNIKKKTKHNNKKVKIQKQTLQDLMTIQQHGKAATTGDVLGGNKLGAKLPSKQTVTKEVNRMVHGIRCHAIRSGLSTRKSFARSTLKSPKG